MGQLWSISTTTLQVRMKVQLNTLLYAKTLVRKDVASSSASSSDKDKDKDKKDGDKSKAAKTVESDAASDKKEAEGEFSSKAQIMTLMTTDVDRVSEFAWHFFALIGKSSMLVINY